MRHFTSGLLSAICLLVTGAVSAAPTVDKAPTRPGKPSAPIELRYVVDGKPAAGVPLSIDLEVTAKVAAESLRFEVAAQDPALTLMAGAKSPAGPTPGRRAARRVVVLPRRDGQYYLDVIATVVRNGVPQARAFSVPVRVGVAASPAKAHGDAKAGVISLPAIESGSAP